MLIASADDVRRCLPPALLAGALRAAFAGDTTVPLRHHHSLPQTNAPVATLLLMPAWTADFTGVKIVSVYPGNADRRLPAVNGTYLLSDGQTGAPLMLADGAALTSARTAAASALAAQFLARETAETLLVCGAGAVARALVHAHSAVRPIRKILVWNRTPAAAGMLASDLCDAGLDAVAIPDLEAAVRQADIVSCATMATQPLVSGAWLQPGTHLDLVGGFTPHMREADDDAVRIARVYADTMAGALAEAGDIVDPLRRGIIAESDICGDLHGLCRGTVRGRRSGAEITLFKSVGTALEDLAAATALWHALGGRAGAA